eukprot:gene1821-3529_t
MDSNFAMNMNAKRTGLLLEPISSCIKRIKSDVILDPVLPEDLEDDLVGAIFEIGLKNASPKVLRSLMPPVSCLSDSHVKSHLQKQRVRPDKAKEEFLHMYHDNMQHIFRQLSHGCKQENVRKDISTGNNLGPIQVFNAIENDIIEKTVINCVEKSFMDWHALFQDVMMAHSRVQSTLCTGINSVTEDSGKECTINYDESTPSNVLLHRKNIAKLQSQDTVIHMMRSNSSDNISWEGSDSTSNASFSDNCNGSKCSKKSSSSSSSYQQTDKQSPYDSPEEYGEFHLRDEIEIDCFIDFL